MKSMPIQLSIIGRTKWMKSILKKLRIFDYQLFIIRYTSHIKPWKVSNEKTERTNPRNGLCLNALHDKAFDKGLITLDKDYRIVISKRLSDVRMDENTQAWFYSYENHKIKLPDKFFPGRDFIEYHNDVIFQG